MITVREKVNRYLKGELEDIISELENIRANVLNEDYSREEIVEEIDDLLDRM